jgi:hypothetical protein
VLTIIMVVKTNANTTSIRSNSLRRLIVKRCLSFMIVLHGTFVGIFGVGAESGHTRLVA